MLSEITFQEFKEWMTYADVEPLDLEIYQLAQIAQFLYNINRDSKKDPKGKALGEFVLGAKFDKPAKPAQTAEFIQREIEGWIAVHNTLEEAARRRKEEGRG